MLTLEQIKYINDKPLACPVWMPLIVSESEAEFMVEKEGIEWLREQPIYVNRKIKTYELSSSRLRTEPKRKAYQSKWP
jgi:hypothetical protein